jgi:hypothetical protein
LADVIDLTQYNKSQNISHKAYSEYYPINHVSKTEIIINKSSKLHQLWAELTGTLEPLTPSLGMCALPSILHSFNAGNWDPLVWAFLNYEL